MSAECFLGCLGFFGAVPAVRTQKARARVGVQLGGKYSVHRMIGCGAYGSVYAAADIATSEEVAVKVINRSRSKLRDIEAEAAIMRRLVHRNIISLKNMCVGPEVVCLVMERFKGGDIIEALRRHSAHDPSPIACSRVVHVAAQMCAAVRYLHECCVVHRDIKGDNLLLDQESLLNPACRIALGDFGTAVSIAQGQRLSNAVGTKRFWSPEFYRQNYAEKVDVWAVGVVVYTMVAFNFPFRDEVDVMQLEPVYPKRLSPGCRDFLNFALQKLETKRASSQQLVAQTWVRNEDLATRDEEADGCDCSPRTPSTSCSWSHDLHDTTEASLMATSKQRTDEGLFSPAARTHRASSFAAGGRCATR